MTRDTATEGDGEQAMGRAGETPSVGPSPNPPVAQSKATLLVFDLDNTLVQSRIDFQAIRRELIGLLHQAGATPDAPETLLRLPIPELILLAEAHDDQCHPERTEGSCPDHGQETLRSAHDDTSSRLHAPSSHRASLAARCWQVVLRYEYQGMQSATVEPDAETTLAQAKARGYRLAVLTNNTQAASQAALQHFGLWPYFDLILGRDDVASLKPAGDGVRHARGHFNGTVERVVVIGDSYIDGLAAQHAGADFIAFRPDTEDLSTRGITPRHTIRHLAELLELDL